MPEDTTPEQRQITGSKRLGLRVLDWHVGQFTPTYAVGSSFYAGNTVPEDTVKSAIRELRRELALQLSVGNNGRGLLRVISSLENLL